MYSTSTIRNLWDELRQKSPFPVCESDQINVRLSRAKTLGGQMSYGAVPTLSISTVLHPEANDDLRVTILHEMAHLISWRTFSVRGHGPQWKKVFRQLLDANGFDKVPTSRTLVAADGSAYERPPGAVRTQGFMYYCQCKGRTEADGGYGIRTRRSLDGRVCRRCRTTVGCVVVK